MQKRIKIWCSEGILTCRNADLKFTEYGIMLEGPEEEIFIPYGSLNLIRCEKGKGKSHDIRLKKADKEW